MDQERSDLNRPEEDPLEQRERGQAGPPTETDPRLPPQGSTGVADEGEDHGFGERPPGSEDGPPGGEFEPTPTEDGDRGPGSGGD